MVGEKKRHVSVAEIAKGSDIDNLIIDYFIYSSLKVEQRDQVKEQPNKFDLRS